MEKEGVLRRAVGALPVLAFLKNDAECVVQTRSNKTEGDTKRTGQPKPE
jgi:hypothetical protein